MTNGNGCLLDLAPLYKEIYISLVPVAEISSGQVPPPLLIRKIIQFWAQFNFLYEQFLKFFITLTQNGSNFNKKFKIFYDFKQLSH